MEDAMKKILSYGALAGIVLVLAGLVIWTSKNVWGLASWITVGLGAALMIAYVVLCFNEVKAFFSLRGVRYGGNALAAALVVFALLGMLNFVVNRHSVKFDLTSAKQFSLSDQTKNVLSVLRKDVKATAFVQSENQQRIEDLFKLYRFESKRFSFEFVDPDRKPGIAKQYGVTAYGTVVFECGAKVERVTELEEAAFTNALIKVTREGKKVVYFLSGHGECDPDDTGRSGLSSAKKAIQNENYDVQKIVLAEKKTVPADCELLVIAGAKKAPFPTELDSIQAYLDRGGKAFFMLDPDPSFGFNDFLSKWGIDVGNDVVLDVSGMGQLFGMGPEIPLVSSYTPHAITRNFKVMTFFPMVRSVSASTNKPSGITVETLFKTGPNSWGETDLKNPQARYDAGKDKPGPITLAAVVTKESAGKKIRLAVFGDSDFATNAYFGAQGNGDLCLNTIGWLSEEEDLISVRAKSPENRPIDMTAGQARFLFFLTVVFMPLAALITGVCIYIVREKR
jgi:ABC-type uncharacterized transport system involved in gliding motility auxiliary subunit